VPPETTSRASDNESGVRSRESGVERRGSKVEAGARVATVGVLAVGTRFFSRWRRKANG
jgi:hypothetical protein